MGDELPPLIVVNDLTDDQVAILALLDIVPEEGMFHTLTFLEPTPASLLALAPQINGKVLKEYNCPVVVYRGVRRAILPNGDIWQIERK